MVDLDRRQLALGALRAHGRGDGGRPTDPDRRPDGGPALTDPRLAAYARLLVEQCLDVQPGWQVVVSAGMLARPLAEDVSRLLGRRGAHAVQGASLGGAGVRVPWAPEP